MVGEKNVTAVGGEPKKFHQKLCVFLDTAGCNRHDPDAQTRGLADAFLKAGNHFRLLVRTSVKHQKTYPRHRIFAPFLTKNSLLQRTVYGFRKIAAATCELLLNKFHGLGNIWRKPAAFGDIFVAFVAVKHRTHSVSERRVAAFGASDHVKQFGFQVFDLVAHAAGGIYSPHDVYVFGGITFGVDFQIIESCCG